MADITEPLVTDSLQTTDILTQGITQATADSLQTADTLIQSITQTSIDQLETADTLLPAKSSTLVIDSVQTLDAIDGSSTITESLLTDSVATTDAVNDSSGTVLLDTLKTSDSASDHNEATQIIRDQLETADSSEPIWADAVSDSVQTVDASVPHFSDAVSDTLKTADSTPAWDLTQVVVDQLYTWDSVDENSRFEFITDSVGTADSVTDARSVTDNVSDALQATDALTHYAFVLETLVDQLTVFDSAAGGPSVLNEVLLDQVETRDSIYSADPNAIAWVMNTETGAPYYFTRFDFLHVTEHAGMLFAGSRDGLYLLEGQDDAGNDIDAEIVTGFLDFESPQKKRIPNLYFGYTGGELECDVETYDQPNDVYTYGMDAREADAPRNNRIQLGKGLTSRYWRLTIRNLAGAAFQLYDTVADVVSSKRRL